MRAIDVMTANVITVHPSTSVQAVAKLLSEQAISGVPVVDAAGRLVGIVSEGDLLHRVETGTERRPGPLSRRRRSSWWLDTIGSPQARIQGITFAFARVRDEVESGPRRYEGSH